jgi:hypothetical protein
MKRSNQTKRAHSHARDEKKEAIFKELSQILAESGHTVRREQLKQGHGWKVVSGVCRADQASMVFVDRRMPQDDQIAFLSSRISSLKLQIAPERLSKLPEKVVELLTASHVNESAALV